MKRLWICAVLLVLLTACGGNTASPANEADGAELSTGTGISENTCGGNTASPANEADGAELLTGTGNSEAAASEDFYLAISELSPGDTELEFSIVNAAGADAEVLLIPALETKGENGEWESISLGDGIGFCGTPDPLPVGEKEWSLELGKLWNNLYAGEYRLSFAVTDASGQEHTASGEFMLCYDIVQIER